MHVLAIPCIAMAAINFYVGLYHFVLFLKYNKIKEHLPFSLTCFIVFLYDIFCIGLYNSTSVDEGVFWEKLQLNSLFLVAIFLMWFLAVFINKKEKKVIIFFILSFMIFLILSYILDPNLTLTPDKPFIKKINFLNLIKINYYEAKTGILYKISFLISIIAFAYFFLILIINYFKKRDNNVILIIIGFAVYALGTINDELVTLNIYQFFYLGEYSFSFLIISMSYILINRFVNLHKSIENLNINLEHKVTERTKEIKKLNEELKHLADIDFLTGIYNRRFFNEYFEIELKRVKNQVEYQLKSKNKKEIDMNFGIAMIDIDNFKKINDKYGHLSGDIVIKQIVSIIKQNIFSRDILCRYGGEEFILLLTKTSTTGIHQAIEKIRKEIEKHPFNFDDNNNQKVTVSIGVVSFNEIKDVVDIKSKYLLKIADERLLIAKRTGKNKVIYNNNSL